MPNAEFIDAMSKQLSEADAYITSVDDRETKSRVESERIRKQDEALVDDLRKLREQVAPLPELIRVLKEIVLHPKAARTAATGVLQRFGLMPADPVSNALPKTPAKLS